MAGKKNQFPCGHVGKGKYCHRCEQEERERQRQLDEKMAKQRWKESFREDPVDLSLLPSPALVEKAREMIREIQRTKNYTAHHGKRLNYDRAIISVPLSRSYRLLFRESDGALTPIEVMSHEEYNVKKPGK